jgi:outer membrane protein insertion porin family
MRIKIVARMAPDMVAARSMSENQGKGCGLFNVKGGNSLAWWRVVLLWRCPCRKGSMLRSLKRNQYRKLAVPAFSTFVIAAQLASSFALGIAPAYAEGTISGEINTSATAEGSTSAPTELPDKDLTVEDVTVEGNRLVPSEDILGVIKTRRGDKFDRDQVMRDLKAVNGLGYFDDRSLQVVPEMSGSSGVLLKIRVTENAPVTQFAFQGNGVLSSEDLAHLFSDQLGKPQNLTQLSQAIDKVEQAYHEKGYMLARVVDVKDDPDGSVSVKIDEGVVDQIKIVGNKKTKDFIIRNAIKMKPGTVYNERQLTADLRKLYGNGYFQDIRRSLTPDPEHPEKYVLKVEVDEKRTGSVGLGGGVDTIAGPFGSFSFADSNFRGRGQIVSFSSQVGSGMFGNITNNINNGGTQFLPNTRTYQLEASFIEPNLRGGKTSLALSGFARNYGSMMVDDASQRTLGTSMTFSRPLKGAWSGSLSLGGEQTNLKSFSNIFSGSGNIISRLSEQAMAQGYAMDPVSAQQFAQQVRNDQLQGGLYASFTPTLYRDTRDNVMDPNKGSFAKITGGPSVGITGASFAKVGASYSKYIPINKSMTLAMNMQGGSAFGGVPGFAQYRLGGWNGIRGYRAFSDLGTGTGMLMGSIELRGKIPFIKDSKNAVARYFDKNVRPVGFFDFGAVSGAGITNSLYQRGTMGGSVGVGLRWNVPMLGLVRLDYGFPLISTALGRMTPRFTLGFGDKF